MNEELTDAEINLLKLIKHSEGRHQVYDFHDSYVRFYHDPKDFLLIPRLADLGMLEGVSSTSNTDEFQRVKLALSKKGKQFLKEKQVG